MANVIAKVQKPTLVVVRRWRPSCTKFKCFFPHNAVEYFVSYYDYYQPEAYIPSTDTYIAKDASINDTIDQMRHAATRPGDGLKDRGCATVSIQRKMLAITARRRHPSCHNVRRLTSSQACGWLVRLPPLTGGSARPHTDAARRRPEFSSSGSSATTVGLALGGNKVASSSSTSARRRAAPRACNRGGAVEPRPPCRRRCAPARDGHSHPARGARGRCRRSLPRFRQHAAQPAARRDVAFVSGRRRRGGRGRGTGAARPGVHRRRPQAVRHSFAEPAAWRAWLRPGCRGGNGAGHGIGFDAVVCASGSDSPTRAP